MTGKSLYVECGPKRRLYFYENHEINAFPDLRDAPTIHIGRENSEGSGACVAAMQPHITTNKKMSAKKIIHDLPRLAKESGFFFHFRSRKIDWSDIAELDVEELANSRNFEMLEAKMNLVVNCDLNDDITKVLDRDFVKLFRLAQLSISYLLHCQWYLDTCVLMLQEQLSTTLKGSESSKSVHDKQVYQCKDCEKHFLSASYLSSHQKRRHNALAETATQTEVFQTQNKQQQTEDVRTTCFGMQTDLIMTQNVGVMTDSMEASLGSNELAEMMERMKAVEEELAKAKLENTGTPVSVQDQREEPVDGKNDLKAQTDFQKDEVASLANIVEQLVPLIHNLQNQQGVKESASSVADAPGEIVVEPEATTQMPDSREDLIDFGTPVLQAKEDQFHTAPGKENESTESSHNDSEKQIRQRTRKKVYQSQELQALEQAPPPRPTPRTKAGLKKQKTLIIVDDKPDKTDEDQEEVKNEDSEASSKTHIAKKVADEAMRKIQERRVRQDENKREVPEQKGDFVQFLGQKSNEVAWPASSSRSYDFDEEPPPRMKKQNSLIEEPDQNESSEELVVEDPIVKESAKAKSPNKTSFFKNLVKGTPKLKNLTSSLKRSWSNLYEASRRKQEDVRDLLGGSQSEVNLTGQSGDEGVERLLGMKLRALGVDPEWSGITDDTFDRAMEAMRHNQAFKSKAIPGYAIVRDAVERRIDEEVEQAKKTMSNAADASLLPSLKMYDSSGSDSEISDDYSAKIIQTPVTRMDDKQADKSSKLHEIGKDARLGEITQTAPSPSQESYSSESPVRVTPGAKAEQTGTWIFNSVAGPSKGFSFLSKSESKTTSAVEDLDFHSDEPINSNRSFLETNINESNKFTQEPIEDDLVDEFLLTEELLEQQRPKVKQQTLNISKESVTKIIKKPATMYTMEDSSSIESIEDTPPKSGISKGSEQRDALIAPLKIGEPPKRHTDFSIFQAGNKSEALKKKPVTSSDSEEDVKKETPVLKSAIQSKTKDEIRKRVVFADNFPLEVNATSRALLDVADAGAADSGSDWDISM